MSKRDYPFGDDGSGRQKKTLVQEQHVSSCNVEYMKAVHEKTMALLQEGARRIGTEALNYQQPDEDMNFELCKDEELHHKSSPAKSMSHAWLSKNVKRKPTPMPSPEKQCPFYPSKTGTREEVKSLRQMCIDPFFKSFAHIRGDVRHPVREGTMPKDKDENFNDEMEENFNDKMEF